MSTSAPSLTLVEARDRARLLQVHETTVELDLTGDGDSFVSRTMIRFSCREPGATTFLDVKAQALRHATLNGRELDPSAWDGHRISITELAAENVLEVEGEMAYSSDGEGLHRHVDPADGRTYLYAMSFLEAAPRWFACFDQPDLKSRYRLVVTAPPSWTVLGNGPSTQREPGRWTIEPLHRLSTYFVTLVAGEYASVRAEHDGIPLAFHVRASLGDQLREQAPDLIEVTGQCLDYYHRTFGVRYPFGEYHQAFVPDFNAGAMENPGCVTLRDHYIFRSRATVSERAGRAAVIAHEMAHMWFGDLVTMRWWDDLWLNESFAEYMAYRCASEATAYPLWAEFGIVRKDWGSVADQSPSTHPVASSGAGDAAAALQNFDGISYAKGAAVLKQLVAHLGDEVFFDGLDLYFSDHQYDNATFADLLAAWTRVGARDLEKWAAQWLRTSGMDVLTYDDGRVQRTAPDQARRPHAVTVGFFDAAGTELGRQPVHLNDDSAPVAAPTGTELVVPDVGDDTWARIRFGRTDFTRAADVVGALEDESIRVVTINAIRDAVRNAELDPVEAQAALLRLLASEPSDAVVSSMLRFAVDQLAGPYAAPNDRDLALHRIHEAVASELANAPASSDRALALFRVAVRSSSDVDLLRNQLEGRRLPNGLDLDPELEWALVDRLAVLTGDPGIIDRQTERDRSAAAVVHAARARAGLPDPEAKSVTWRRLIEPSKIGAYELYANAEGFFRPAQDDLTRPYAIRYFHEMPATADFRSGWVLGRVAELAFPTMSASSEVLDLATRTLQREDLAAPVRRAMVDGTDRLRRALIARQTYRSA